ncbi:MAG TPA: aldose 1-epimerase family protein [Chryseosolibacter sp.]
MNPQAWRDKISNTAQLGGIETSVLDNGPGRGTRIAWINTGTGLRYKVVIDRAMDIADAFYNQHSLSWISHAGITSREPFSHRGADWLRTFGGGLLTTCGLSHFGPPEADSYGERGLHGLISNQAAEIESIVQPDPLQGKMDMSITGRIKETKIFGPGFELRRTLSGTLGEAMIRIHDEVRNVANTPVPHMLLYHCNFGWPLVDEGTDILWQGSWQSPNEGGAGNIFREGSPFRTCPAPMEKHRGGGEAVAFIDPAYDDAGQCSCGLYNENLQIAVELRFDKKQLPWLTNWQHWGKGEYVTGLEPGTNPPIGQAKARQQNQLIEIAPGETRSYDLEFEVFDTESSIRELLKKYKL